VKWGEAMSKEKLMEGFFNPESIAVVGASDNPKKAGYIIVHNLIQKGFQRPVYPVNHNVNEVQGIKAYPLLSQIPEDVELVVLITPAAMIHSVMDDLEKRMEEKGDVKALVCAAADYGETKTEEGINRQNRLLETCNRYGIRVLGPNCIGVINNLNGVDTTFVDPGIPPSDFKMQSGISIVSQSGSIATSIMFMGASRPLPVKFNKFVSLGNMTDVDFIDILEYYERDDSTRVVGIYMEGYPKGKMLIEIMGRIARKKPVVILKVGRGVKGAKAANSHTGSLAGTDAVYDAAFKQYGIIRVAAFRELIDTLLTLERMPMASGRNFYVLSQTGGFGIFCTDLLEELQFVNMPKISEDTCNILKKQMPVMSTIDEPEGYSDITVSASEEQHAQGLTAVLKDDKVDGVFFLTVTPTFLQQERLGHCLAEAYNSLEAKYKKPAFICIMAGDYVKKSRYVLEEEGLCSFDTPNEAVMAAKHLIWYAEYLKAKEVRS